jgi:hypothetical protein
MTLLIALILLLTKPGQDQEFIKSELTILDVCHYDITIEDSVRFTIYPDHNVYTGWKTDEYKNRMYDNK